MVEHTNEAVVVDTAAACDRASASRRRGARSAGWRVS